MNPPRPALYLRRTLRAWSLAALALSSQVGVWAQATVASETRPDAAAQAATAPVSAPGAGVAPDGVQAVDLDWIDAQRKRSVPVRLYWPAEPASQGAVATADHAPRPLLVFSHGIGGSRRGYSYLGRHLASQGIASLHLQHVGSDRSVWGGNPLALLLRLHGAAQEAEAIERVGDLRFALDELLDRSSWGARIDRDRIAAAGHSYGANTVMLAAGAQVTRDGVPLSLREPRLRAAVLLSAPPFYGEGDPTRILQGVTLPSLHITATEDVIRIPGFYSPASDREVVYHAIGGATKALAVFEGGSHSVFTDWGGTGGVVRNPQVKQATKLLIAAFLQQVFGGAGDALTHWPQQHRELVAKWQRD